MKFRYISCLIFLVAGFSSFGQNYSISWQRTIGGNNSDKLTRTILTSDGGMMLCGFSNSDISGDKAQNSFGAYDFWIVKLSSTGRTQWSKTYGGTDRDIYPSIIQTADGGYLIGGSSISPASGSKTKDAINQSFDYWVIKLDKSGNQIWDNTIGGIQFEKFATVLETSTAYLVCGSSNSTQGYDKTLDNQGSSLWPDYWVIKMTKSGSVLWDSVYGSTNRDELTAAIVTADGKGIILGGSSYSPRGGNKKDNYIGNNDFWIIKIDTTGIRQWDRTIGGALSDYLTAIDTVGNTGYVFAGYSNSPASFNKTDSCRGGTDYWVVKTDKSGAIVWDKTFGGAGEDYATSVKFISGNYLIGGYSNSGMSGDKTSPSKGGMDFWTLQLDKNGNILQQYDWGGTGDDYLSDYLPNGSGFLLAGTSNSPKGRDKKNATVGNTGNNDYWVFKLSAAAPVAQAITKDTVIVDASAAENIKSQLSLDITPNPVKDMLNLNYVAGTTGTISLSVYSNSGKLIKQQILSQSNGSVTIDFSAQSSGVYYAVLQSGTSSMTKKFVKN